MFSCFHLKPFQVFILSGDSPEFLRCFNDRIKTPEKTPAPQLVAEGQPVEELKEVMKGPLDTIFKSGYKFQFYCELWWLRVKSLPEARITIVTRPNPECCTVEIQ